MPVPDTDRPGTVDPRNGIDDRRTLGPGRWRAPPQFRELVFPVFKTADDGGTIGRPDVVARFHIWGRVWPLYGNSSLIEGGEIIAVWDVIAEVVAHVEMTLPRGFAGGVWGDGSADERSRAAAARGAAGFGSAKIDDRSSGAAARAPSASSVSVVEGLSDRRSDRPDLETSWSPPRCTRDRALTGGEAAPLDEPWRASHRSGHDDAKALLQAHRHLISRGTCRPGEAEPFASGPDAPEISMLRW